MKAIGFTGTREGMSVSQRNKIKELLVEQWVKGARVAHHGICKGADIDFHHLAKEIHYEVIGHPGQGMDGSCYTRGVAFCDEVMPAKYYFERDKDIVNASDVMLATPKSHEVIRSGTWTTVRYARKVNKPIYIVMPEGDVVEENVQSIAK